jgi:hypothetical protein
MIAGAALRRGADVMRRAGQYPPLAQRGNRTGLTGFRQIVAHGPREDRMAFAVQESSKYPCFFCR